MKFNLNILALGLISVTLFGACAENKQAPISAYTEKLGTGDSGGGNLYKGRPIESYGVDITQTSAYKTKIAPIVDALTNPSRMSPTRGQLSNPDLGRMFLTILNKRTWYLIPGPLDTLPKSRTGLVVPSEQGALQGPKEIWMDSNLFNLMSEQDQATLILHEVLMGLKILRFASNYEQCMSFAPEPQLCLNSLTTPNGDIRQLTPQDYADIRFTVLEIMKSYSSMSYAEWDDLMARKSFSMNFRSFNLKEDQGTTTGAEVVKNIQKSFITEKAPNQGFKTFPTLPQTNPSEACQLSLVETGTEGTWEFHLKTPTENRRILLKIPKSQTFNYFRYNVISPNFKISSVNINQTFDHNNIKAGDRYLSLRFLFDLNTWEGVEIQENIISEAHPTGGYTSEDYENGFYYLCIRSPMK